jgi:hypothetical protein
MRSSRLLYTLYFRLNVRRVQKNAMASGMHEPAQAMGLATQAPK